MADYFQYADDEDYLRQQLAPSGLKLDDLRRQGYANLPNVTPPETLAWNTPSHKIELYSATLKTGGFAPVPEWDEPLSPAADQFYLLTGKVGQHTQFGTQNNGLLHKYQDEPRLWMNPEAAQRLGLKDNDLVAVKSAVGSVNVALQVTEAIRPDCVYLTPGFGHLSQGLLKAYGVGASDSVLHVSYTDPASGSQALSQTFVSVQKVAG